MANYIRNTTSDGVVIAVEAPTPTSTIYQNSDDYWAFSEGSGTTIGNDNGAKDAEFVSINSWVSGSGLEDYYIKVDSDEEGTINSSMSDWAHFINNGKGAMGAWVNPDNTNDQMIIGSGIQANGEGFAFGISNGAWYCRIYNGSNSVINISGGSPSSGSWQSLVFATDSGSGYLYADASEVASGVMSNTASGDLTDFVQLAGISSTAQITTGFKGGYDNVFHNSTGFTASEVQEWHDINKSLYP